MALVAHHWHGYGPWLGSHEFFQRQHEHERRPGDIPGDAQTVAFIAANTPPMQNGHYLLRQSQTTPKRTWTDLQGPLAWLTETYAQCPPDPTLRYGTPADWLEHTEASLRHGGDATWHYTTSKNGNRVVTYAVISCPHRHLQEIPCPLPPM
ncbi:hypothetical protein ACIBF5_08225 [Micromonospora sp. NPDC050417]|uniref:hypothetical protein n=1 Tax=Micromonospora sp. NPDC050417 TaxID=3364280 RepID=UPI0037B89C31